MLHNNFFIQFPPLQKQVAIFLKNAALTFPIIHVICVRHIIYTSTCMLVVVYLNWSSVTSEKRRRRRYLCVRCQYTCALVKSRSGLFTSLISRVLFFMVIFQRRFLWSNHLCMFLGKVAQGLQIEESNFWSKTIL
jgi:hypothetical protein